MLAQDIALAWKRPLLVVFCMAPAFLGATLRQYDFMLRGLRETAGEFENLGIPFALLQGPPPDTLAAFVRKLDAPTVVTDFDPLRLKREWQSVFPASFRGALVEVDGHNVVPCRMVSPKQEVGARTLRPKISKLLSDFLEPFPELLPHPHRYAGDIPASDWGGVLTGLGTDCSVPVVKTTPPGPKAGSAALRRFLENRLHRYADKRNDPNAGAVSRLSAYFHFGQLAPHRAALEALAMRGAHGGGEADENVQAFLEELIVRRELSDNFCLYNERYDSLEGAPQWALASLDKHRGDPRPYVYEYEAFEKGATHSPLWNAAQGELLRTGAMHGYMRMYWAKKILEWSESPEQAHDIALRLNDRFQLDGRDPNGYVGVLWSIGGLHDRPWKEREVYGSIRYMNARGCKRKFDSQAYIDRWTRPGLM